MLGPCRPYEGGARPNMRLLAGVERGQSLAVVLDVQQNLEGREFVYLQVLCQLPGCFPPPTPPSPPSSCAHAACSG